jgi:hypothetical protein
MTDFNFTALYQNGDELTLSDTLSFDNIPREDLIGMKVRQGNTVILTVHLEPGQKLIYRYRPVKTLGKNPEQETEPFIWLVGVREKIGDRTVQFITYIVNWIGKGYTLHQAGKFNDNHPWFYSPALHQHEALPGERYQVDGIWRTK